MSLEIVELDTRGDEWDRALARFPADRADVYFESAYSLLWQAHGDGRALGAIWEDDHGRVLNPFLLRDLGALATLGRDAAGLFDIASAYGYGGPLVDSPEGGAGTLARFRSAFENWCREHAVVSEFIRFHPLLETQRGLDPHVDVIPAGETVWCRVDVEAGDLAAGMDSSHRRNLRKAQNAGLIAAVETSGAAYDEFRELYTQTMARRGAVSSYFFDAAYFESFRRLGPRQALIGVRSDGVMIAGGVLMRSQRLAHYHLGGSSAAHLGLRPNDLFFFASMEWARDCGASALHLGGGYRPDDELLRFKRGIGRGRAQFSVGRKIHLPAEYDRLTTLHRQRVGEGTAGYFPRYRAPLAAPDASTS